MPGDRVMDEVRAAVAAAQDETAQPSERAEMLLEIAIGLQNRPKTSEPLHETVRRDGKVLAICPAAEISLCARIITRKAKVPQAVPENGVTFDRAAVEQAPRS